MELIKVEKNGIVCAAVRGNDIVIMDAQSALELLMPAKYEFGTKNIVIDKRLIAEAFFILSRQLRKTLFSHPLPAKEPLILQGFPK